MAADDERSTDHRPTVLVLGDQLDRHGGALGAQGPGDVRVLPVESVGKIAARRWHVQRALMIVSAIAHFAAELTEPGFDVDHRRAPSIADGVRAHCDEFDVERVLVTEPRPWAAASMVERMGLETVRDDHFLCHRDDFAAWARDRKSLRLEDFYRWQRTRLDVLMDAGTPLGGRWNFDADNRLPPSNDGRSWPSVEPFEADEIDAAVLSRLPDSCWGELPQGRWPVTRGQALQRLDEFIADGLPRRESPSSTAPNG